MVGAGIFHKGYCLFKKLIAKSNEYDRTFDPGRTAALKASLPTPEYQQRTCSQPTKLYKRVRPFLLCLQALQGCCQTNENSHQIASAAWIYALNNWRHSARAAARFSLNVLTFGNLEFFGVAINGTPIGWGWGATPSVPTPPWV